MNRREILAAAALFPGAGWLAACSTASSVSGSPSPAPYAPLAPFSNDERWWRELRRQFYIADGIFFNTGTFGASPRAVVDATIAHLTAFETVFHQQGVDGAKLFRSLGALVGSPPENLALTRNTTESMNVVARGIDLGPADTIVSTTHEHVGGICCWQLVAKRYGAKLVTFTPPLDPASPQELVDAWVAASPPGTKVWSISHILFSTGMIQPLALLTAEARKRGIITVVDGAHPPGMLQLDITALGPDFYASSPHKWILAPKGSGFLYISPAWIDRLWPLAASGGWDDLTIKGMRFDHVGTRNDSITAGLRNSGREGETILTFGMVRSLASSTVARPRMRRSMLA